MASRSPESVRRLPDERQLELLLSAVTDYAIYMLDPEGFVATWNAGAQRIKGYAREEIVGQHFSKFFTDEDQQRDLPRQILSLVRQSGRYESEGWRVRKDGRRFWAVAVMEAIRDQATGALIGFAKVTRDITERHETRRALAESEHRFRLLVEGVADYAICMLDPSGVITNWNAGAARIKGYATEEIVGSHFSRFYTKQDRARGLPAQALDVAKREGKYEAEGWRVRKDGGQFWAADLIEPIRGDAGELVGFAKITRDITERKSAQEALRDSERQFRLLVAGVTDCAIYMLDPNGIIVSWNAGAHKIKGYTADEIIGQHFSRFYTDEDRAAGLPARALYAATQDGRFATEGQRVRKDGTRFWANVVVEAIHEDGRLLGFAKITRDITQQREAQAALRHAQEQLAHSQKMDALGQLTGGIAHDFNNLLTIIGGQTRIIKGLVSDPKGLKAASAIEATVLRGAALTRQLLGFSRKQRLDPEPVALSQRVEALQTMLASTLPDNVRLLTSVLPDTWPAMADPSELELAILNLVLNARDAMPEGGVITITAENARSSPSSDLHGDFIAISIADTGEGIPPELLAKVFDPFFTTKRAHKGTGLGLSQVYGFAHQSGGTVKIESDVGKGTRVTLYLPRAQCKTPAPTATEEPLALPRPDVSILIVEDNHDVTEVTSAVLKQLGYDVHVAADAKDALKRLETNDFDLVFSDIMMPGPMDGVALARAIRARHAKLPVLLVSGSNKRVEAAPKEFPTLQKPYQIFELSRAIASALGSASDGATQSNLVDLRFAKRRRALKPEAR
jgi:PAS domain S-box-containing protein